MSIDPRQLLQQELTERCERNPRYSLRAFAKAIGMSHTVLSLVLSGKRGLSRKAALKAADVLELDPALREAFLASCRRGAAYEFRLSPAAQAAATQYRELSMDAFATISDWHPFAILSLLETPGAKLDASWIAKRLRIPTIQARIAIERLERLGLVAWDEKLGRHRQSGAPLKIENKQATQAARKYNQQLLKKALSALDESGPEGMNEHEYSSVTFAMSAKQIPYARERIRGFRRELMAELEAQNSPEEVYELAVQLFPVSKPAAVAKTNLKRSRQ